MNRDQIVALAVWLRHGEEQAQAIATVILEGVTCAEAERTHKRPYNTVSKGVKSVVDAIEMYELIRELE